MISCRALPKTDQALLIFYHSSKCLEERQLLSTVTIYAQGSTGQEVMELLVNDVVVNSWTVPTSNPFNGGVSNFQTEVEGDVTPDQIKVRFTNDFYDPANGIDRNLRVDRIQN